MLLLGNGSYSFHSLRIGVLTDSDGGDVITSVFCNTATML